ncbi:hypothetical protein E4T44_00984 [Aureobasidium sp. EXF-8845]|nr:hypothetical protein E4T44_00984 [Aureobasidium sp. EXF-8845]KAI4857552.1 hypothetical protein E4T45_00951 [Aureobasidium sp. EXF-8846]
MATQADIDALNDKLSTSGPLSWVIADCPVVAVFRNNETQKLDALGQPLDRNGCGDLLRLWVGLNQDTRELFVTLTIRIRLRSSTVGYTDLVEHLSQQLFDAPSDTESAKCELLQMSVHLGPYVSDVIMPEFQCRSNVMPQAMALLRKLKSLSEASSFQLYTNPDASRQAAIKHVSNILLGSSSMITPSIDLKGFYPGGRSACKNMWLDQGWLEAGAKSKSGREDPVEGDKKELQTMFDPRPPPPYEPNIEPDRAHTSSISDRVPSLPPVVAPLSQEGVPDLLATAFLGSDTPVSSSSHHESVPSVINHLSTIIRRFSPSTPAASLSSGYTATFLSGFPDQSPLRRLRNTLTAEANAAPTNSLDLAIQVAASSVEDYASPDGDVLTRANTPSDIVGRVPDSVYRKRLSSYILEEDVGNISKRQVLIRQSPQRLHLDDLRANFSPTIPDTVALSDEGQRHTPTRAMDTSKHETQLSQWLLQAWQHCPTAHYLFIAQLLSYGAALYGDCSQEEIAACHVQCTSDLLAHCTNQILHKEPSRVSTDDTLDDQLHALIRWLYVLRPGADVELFPSLLPLSLLNQQSSVVSHLGVDYDFLQADFMRQKAKVVSEACTRYGAALLQNNLSDLILIMKQEGKRNRI